MLHRIVGQIEQLQLWRVLEDELAEESYFVVAQHERLEVDRRVFLVALRSSEDFREEILRLQLVVAEIEQRDV